MSCVATMQVQSYSLMRLSIRGTIAGASRTDTEHVRNESPFARGTAQLVYLHAPSIKSFCTSTINSAIPDFGGADIKLALAASVERARAGKARTSRLARAHWHGGGAEQYKKNYKFQRRTIEKRSDKNRIRTCAVRDQTLITSRCRTKF